ncbi:MAG TPA: hypothetical protein VMT52_13080 [Planctomycetota bacterium]|nr:hypothetical protein [Planctomycetota bacterium]
MSAQETADGEVSVTFLLESNKKRKLGIDVEFSEDAGLEFTAASTEPDSHEARPAAVAHEIVWKAWTDLRFLPQHDLKVRVTPFDLASGKRGIGGESAVFGLGRNSPPVVRSLSAPAGVTGGIVPFEAEVADLEEDHVRLEGEFALAGGTFRQATLLESEAGGPIAGGRLLMRTTVRWNAQADLPERVARGVRFRVRARDTEVGEFAETALFEVRTLRPLVAALSIEDIDEEMNGSLPFLNQRGVVEFFALMVPTHDFRITLRLEPRLGGARVDPASLSVAWTRMSSSPASEVRAGGVEVGALFAVDEAAGRASWRVPSSLPLPSGTIRLEASVADVLGNRSVSREYSFTAVEPGGKRAPLEEEDLWLLDFDRDQFTIRSALDADGRVALEVSRGPNGIADYAEDLAALGLHRPEAPPGSPGESLGRLVLELTRETIRGYLRVHYGQGAGGAGGSDPFRIAFFLEAPPEPHSLLAIGGDDLLPGFTIGRAEYDHNNTLRNDNSASDLGVFTTNVIEFHVNASFLFRQIFDPFIPGRGVPLGENPLDTTVLDPSFDRSRPDNSAEADLRYDQILTAVDAWSRMTAVVAAHEIGHSIGLVANGAPPRGLFGGEVNAPFAGPYTNAFHLDTPANDIMAGSLSFSDALLDGAAGPRFNQLEQAFLHGRTLIK